MSAFKINVYDFKGSDSNNLFLLFFFFKEVGRLKERSCPSTSKFFSIKSDFILEGLRHPGKLMKL